MEYLLKTRQPVKLHGVDVRIMDEEQAWHLNRLRMKQNIHIAWERLRPQKEFHTPRK